MPTSTRTRLAALACAAGLTLTLSACGQAPWAGLDASGSATPTAKATITVDYSSNLNMGEWTAAANKPVSFSLSATLGTDDGQDVFLSKMTVVTAVTGPTGPLEPPATFVDQSTLSPGYLMKAPYSYGQTYVMSAIDPTATSVTLSFTYELLIQTTPTAASYAKQTASDQITIAIVP